MKSRFQRFLLLALLLVGVVSQAVAVAGILYIVRANWVGEEGASTARTAATVAEAVRRQAGAGSDPASLLTLSSEIAQTTGVAIVDQSGSVLHASPGVHASALPPELRDLPFLEATLGGTSYIAAESPLPVTSMEGPLYLVVLRESGAALAGYQTAEAGALALEILVLALVIAASLNISHHLAAPVAALQRGLELISGANPDYRLRMVSGDEFEAVARRVNELADASASTKSALERQVAEATRAIHYEREKLASVLFALSDGVVVCDSDLRVVLCNRAAQRILGAAGRPARRGKSIYTSVDPSQLRPIIDAVAGGDQEDTAGSVTLGSGDAVWVQAVRAGEEGHYDYVLLLRNSGSDRRHGAGSGLGHWASRAPDDDDTVGKQMAALLGDGSFYDFRSRARPEAEPSGDLLLGDLSLVVFDLETTGLSPQGGDEIVSIAAVRIEHGELDTEDTFHSLVRPVRPIPEGSTRFHGITDAMVRDKPGIDEVLPLFLKYKGDSLLAGHFVSFDLSFLCPRFEALGLACDLSAVMDTLMLSVALLEELGHYNLEDLAGYLGVEVVDRHTALGDAYTTAKVLIRLMTLMQARGVNTLGEALRLQQRSVFERFLGR